MSKTLGPTTSRTRRSPIPDDDAALVARSKYVLANSTITPTPARPNLPEPVGPTATASIAELRLLAGSAMPGVKSTVQKRQWSVRLFAEHLAQFPGHTWQQRWLASGFEEPDALLRSMNPPNSAGWSFTSGFKMLAAMRTIVPSVHAMRRNAIPDYDEMFRIVSRDPRLDEVFRAIDASESSRRYQQIAKAQLAVALTSQAIPIADLTPAALLQFAWDWRDATQSRGRDFRFGALLVWEVLARMGHFPPGTPDTLRLALVGGRRDITQLVDRYPVRNREIRQLLIDYLSHRAVEGIDYTSIDGLSRDLVRNFWLIVESINPEQPDLNLDEQTYQAWLAQVSVVDGPNGPQPRSSLFQLLMRVRAFYLDVQSWASESPERWARWVARCPIPATATHSYNRSRRRQMERMADRTRQRQPLLPLLVEHVTTRWEHYRQLLDRTEAAAPGESFRFAGVAYTRTKISAQAQNRRSSHGLLPSSMSVVDERTDTIIRVPIMAEHAFWTWALVEVLRLTGIRHEELLELTHLSIRQFQRPNGEVVALLVIAPSKTDRERVIPMSVELFHVIAELVRHQTRGGRPVPLLHRWDPLERQHSPLLPFLFQHQIGALRSVFSNSWALGALRRACDELTGAHPEFTGTRFTPHDFRRIFATDLVNNGLPIHIGAALLGHTNLQTTRGYVAVFDEDVVRHYQQFLQHRRELRPVEEYRATTEQEWTEFEEHFDKRKVELGGCARPYGTPCAHEHACIRCPMLQINPKMLPRLDELEADLLTRKARAESEGWIGEIEGLDLTLTFLRDKRDQTRQLPQPGATHLGIPAFNGQAGDAGSRTDHLAQATGTSVAL